MKKHGLEAAFGDVVDHQIVSDVFVWIHRCLDLGFVHGAHCAHGAFWEEVRAFPS